MVRRRKKVPPALEITRGSQIEHVSDSALWMVCLQVSLIFSLRAAACSSKVFPVDGCWTGPGASDERINTVCIHRRRRRKDEPRLNRPRTVFIVTVDHRDIGGPAAPGVPFASEHISSACWLACFPRKSYFIFSVYMYVYKRCPAFSPFDGAGGVRGFGTYTTNRRRKRPRGRMYGTERHYRRYGTL